MRTSVLVMAQGKGTRWPRTGGDVRTKQLLPVGEGTVLERVCRMAFWHLDPTHLLLVAKRALYEDAQAGYAEHFQDPDQEADLLRRILATSTFWAEKTIVLLGDVIYSHAVIAALAVDERPIAFYGRTANLVTGKPLPELVAMVMCGPSQTYTASSMLRVSEHLAARGEDARLWHLFRSLSGLPLLENHPETMVQRRLRNRPPEQQPLLRPVWDWTDDVDTPQERDTYYPMLKSLAESEDRTCLCRRSPLVSKVRTSSSAPSSRTTAAV